MKKKKVIEYFREEICGIRNRKKKKDISLISDAFNGHLLALSNQGGIIYIIFLLKMII